MTKQKIENQENQAAGRLAKVWHITDFEKIFMLSDDARKGRKGPLAYTKSMVSLSGSSSPIEMRHYERLKDLKSRPQRHLLRSAFEELKNYAAHRTQCEQGYLINHAQRPASIDYLAAQLENFDKADLKKAMRILAEIGLIERVELNGQFKDRNEGCPESSGNRPEGSGNDVQSLQEGKAEGEAQAAPEKQKASIGLSADEGEEKDIGNAGKGQYPPATLPIADEMPTESDAGGESEQQSSPPRAAYSREEYPKLDVDYDRHDLYYGETIYGLLNWRGQGKVRESTSFASVWHECREKFQNAGLSPPQIDQFGIRGKRQAGKIARQKGNRAAKWNDFMKKISNTFLDKQAKSTPADKSG